MPVIVIGFLLLSVVLFLFNSLTSGGGKLMMGVLLFVIGFLLYGPDALISGACAVDFGTKKGASSAAGLINGLGSTGQILGMSLPGVISARYGWVGLFVCFGAFILIAALLLLPKWNAVPATVKNNKS
jgi:OPA family sugar phosphate sensor protein UhpC-like MFS transporter